MAIGLIDGDIVTDTETVNAERLERFESFIDAELDNLHFNALATNLVSGSELYEAIYKCISLTSPAPNINCKSSKTDCDQTSMPIGSNSDADGWNQLMKFVLITIICLLISTPIAYLGEYVLGIRCFLPNNYLIWEATRPISDCNYCKGVMRPLILDNMTQEQFQVCLIATIS